MYSEGKNDGLDRMSMKVTKLQTEHEGKFQEGDPTTSLALCLAGTTGRANSQCLQIINTAPIPSMVSQNSSRSFSWIRYAFIPINKSPNRKGLDSHVRHA